MTSLLFNPDPAPSGGGGGGTPAPASPLPVPVQNLASQAVSVSAAAAFPDDAPKGHMQRILDKFRPKSATPPPAAPAPEPASPKPAEPAAAAPAVPTPAPEPPKPAAPPEPPKKIKIGDKEYEVSDLEKIVAGQNQPPVHPASQVPEPPKPPVEPQLTPEQIAAQQDTARQSFLKAQSADVAKYIPTISKERLDKILSGEEGSAQELQAAFSEVAAAAIYQSRDSIYADLNPMIAEFQRAYDELASQVKPLQEHHQTLNQFTSEQTFLKTNPEYAPHVDLYRTANELLRTKYPETNSWTKEQRDAEIKAQIDFAKNAEAEHQSGGKIKDWKVWAKVLEQAAQTASQPAVPAAPAAPAPAPAPAAPPKPRVLPPASNLPGAVPAANGKQLTEAQKIAYDLRNTR